MSNKDKKCTEYNILVILKMEMEAILLLLLVMMSVKLLSSNIHHTSLPAFKMCNWLLQAQSLFGFSPLNLTVIPSGTHNQRVI